MFAQPMIRAFASLALLLATGCASTHQWRPGDPEPPETSFDIDGNRVPSIHTLHSMAHVLAQRGNDPQCERVLRRLIANHPDFIPAYNELAELYLRNEAVDSAQMALELGLERAPDDVVLMNNLGMCQLLAKNYEGALTTFTRATAAHPYDLRTRANMAVALGLLGRAEECEALYRQVTSEDDAYHNVAVLCQARGDAELADQYYARAR